VVPARPAARPRGTGTRAPVATESNRPEAALEEERSSVEAKKQKRKRFKEAEKRKIH
jgi:hypothetical protein